MRTTTRCATRLGRLVAAAGVLAALGGCDGAPADKLTFTKAEVLLVRGKDGAVVNKTVVLEKPEAIERLVKFFPTVGQKRKSGMAAGWKSVVIVTLTDRDGKSHEVSTNYTFWREGRGDWEIKEEGLEEYIAELFKK